MPQNIDIIDGTESASYRPRLSRETRQLLLTALLAVLTLWILARVRFPDRPPAASPVPPILEQLTGTTTFADLAARVAELRAQLADSLVPFAFTPAEARPRAAVQRAVALRIRDDIAVTVVAPASRRAGGAPSGIVGEDRGSGLVLVSTPVNTRPRVPIFWSPRDLQQPRYVLAASTSLSDITLQPAFIGSLAPVETSQWTEPVWALPLDVTIAPGALLFTEQGELVGVVAQCDTGLAVVPARVLLASAERLLESPPKAPADIGVDVDALTPALATVLGAQNGVVVAWVDPNGIAASMLRIGDVIQAIDDVAVASVEQWRVRAARAAVGDAFTLRVTRRGAQRTVKIVLPSASGVNGAALGLGMRSVARVGTEVTRVARGSAAEAAGISPGDLITLIGTVSAPTPAQVTSAFDGMNGGDLLMVGVTRDGVHRVMALQR